MQKSILKPLLTRLVLRTNQLRFLLFTFVHFLEYAVKLKVDIVYEVFAQRNQKSSVRCTVITEERLRFRQSGTNELTVEDLLNGLHEVQSCLHLVNVVVFTS